MAKITRGFSERGFDSLQKKAGDGAAFFVGHLLALSNLLHPEERKSLFDDPVEFSSSRLFFRGLTREKMARLICGRCMEPEAGQMDSVAVFETDSPYQALTFAKGALSALAVIDPSRVDFLTELAEPGSAKYRELAKEVCAKCGRENCRNCFSQQNQIDTSCTSVAGHSWRNIELRRPQPLSAVCCFSVELESGALLLDPSNPADLERLACLYC